MEPQQVMSLSAAQEFEIERMNRIIDGTSDIADLRRVAKQLLTAWMMQKSAAVWAIKQSLLKQADRYE